MFLHFGLRTGLTNNLQSVDIPVFTLRSGIRLGNLSHYLVPRDSYGVNSVKLNRKAAAFMGA